MESRIVGRPRRFVALVTRCARATEEVLTNHTNSDKLALFDDGRNYVAVNNAFCELTGYPREQLLSMKVGRDLNGGDPESNSAFDAVVRGKRRAGTGRIHHADGRFVAINYAVTETEVADLPYFIAVVWPT
jgi:PAS domain S-box-containing protein